MAFCATDVKARVYDFLFLSQSLVIVALVADVQEELRRELFAVVDNQRGRWAVREDAVVNERTGYLARRYPLERHGSNQLGEPIHDYQEVLVAAGTPDEFPEDIDTHRLERCCRWEDFELSHVFSQL